MGEHRAILTHRSSGFKRANTCQAGPSPVLSQPCATSCINLIYWIHEEILRNLDHPPHGSSGLRLSLPKRKIRIRAEQNQINPIRAGKRQVFRQTKQGCHPLRLPQRCFTPGIRSHQTTGRQILKPLRPRCYSGRRSLRPDNHHPISGFPVPRQHPNLPSPLLIHLYLHRLLHHPRHPRRHQPTTHHRTPQLRVLLPLTLCRSLQQADRNAPHLS